MCQSSEHFFVFIKSRCDEIFYCNWRIDLFRQIVKSFQKRNALLLFSLIPFVSLTIKKWVIWLKGDEGCVDCVSGTGDVRMWCETISSPLNKWQELFHSFYCPSLLHSYQSWCDWMQDTKRKLDSQQFPSSDQLTQTHNFFLYSFSQTSLFLIFLIQPPLWADRQLLSSHRSL